MASQLSSKEGNLGNLFGQSAPTAAPTESAPSSEKPAAEFSAPNQTPNGFAGFGQNAAPEKSEGFDFPSPASTPEAEESPNRSASGTSSASPFGEGPGLGNLPKSLEPGDPMPSITEGFSSLFAKSGESNGGSSPKMPWMTSESARSSEAAPNQKEAVQASASSFGFNNDTSAPSEKEPAWSPPPGDQAPEKEPFGFGGSAFPDGAPSKEKPVFSPRDSSQDKGSKKKAKSKGIFSPLVIVVMLLGAIFLGGIYFLQTYGGVEGVKSRVMSRLQTMISSAGQATAAIVEPESPPSVPNSTPSEGAPATDSAPPAEGASTELPKSSGDGPPPATPVAASTALTPALAPAPPATATVPVAQATPPATPATEVSSALPTDADLFIPQEAKKEEAMTATPASEIPASDTPPAPAYAAVAETPAIGSVEMKEPSVPEVAQPGPVGAAAIPTPQVAAPVSTDSGAQAAALPSNETAATPTPAEAKAQEVDPGEKMAAILEPVGEEVIKGFYSTSSIDGRAAYVLDQEANQPRMEAYYRRYQNPPTLRSVSFRGPMRDAASGRWFGVFDVRENENEEVHRWCVVQVRPGEMKLDWVIYQQLIDGSLDRFLADPAAPAKSFNLVIRRGEEAPSDENPWSGTTWEIYVQPPLDTAQPRVLLVRDSDFQRLGLDNALIGGNARIGRVELGWTPSEIEPLTRVPTVTKVLGWGAW
ncbi:MAG: hypothetical protein KDN20_00040 [Verrucomicrobiae bacterium]|nr:hypothetical protein [Verrucomicrobiae bacterium]